MEITQDTSVAPAFHDRLPDDLGEILETIWTMEERGLTSLNDLSREATTHLSSALLKQLSARRLVAVERDRVMLLPVGREIAAQVIRRHRLAERLICDVMGSGVEEAEEEACEFEHLLAERVTSSICTLLGHPRFCPHNRPIPEGDCCRQARDEVKQIVVSCDQLDIGETARIAYVATREHSLHTRLSTLGISPGLTVKLLQKRPSYVVLCEETEIALEKEVARTIYVWQQ